MNGQVLLLLLGIYLIRIMLENEHMKRKRFLLFLITGPMLCISFFGIKPMLVTCFEFSGEWLDISLILFSTLVTITVIRIVEMKNNDS